MRAKEITECENCPLYGNDCSGGWTSNSVGTPIEPPCCSWNDDDEIYEEMYSLMQEWDFSEQELKWTEEEHEQKEKEHIKAREKAEYEEAKKIVYSKTKYGSSPIMDTSSICSAWWCYHCDRWVYPWSESWSGGIGETSCPKCLTTLAHSDILEKGEPQ